jgi:hypothetical protein
MTQTQRRELVARSVLRALDRRERTPAWLAQRTGIPHDELIDRLAAVAAFDVDQLQAVASALDIEFISLLGSEG